MELFRVIEINLIFIHWKFLNLCALAWSICILVSTAFVASREQSKFVFISVFFNIELIFCRESCWAVESYSNVILWESSRIDLFAFKYSQDSSYQRDQSIFNCAAFHALECEAVNMRQTDRHLFIILSLKVTIGVKI